MKLVEIGRYKDTPVWVAPEKVLKVRARDTGPGAYVLLQNGAESSSGVVVDDAVNVVAYRLNAELQEGEKS